MQPPGGVNGTDGMSLHPSMGFTGGRRVGSRWAALIYGGLTSASNASEPTLDRTKADAGGCDAASIAGPCFDIGSTYAASHSATWTGARRDHHRRHGGACAPIRCRAGALMLGMQCEPRHHRPRRSPDAIDRRRARRGRPDLPHHRERNDRRKRIGNLDRRLLGNVGNRLELHRHGFLVNTGGTYGTTAALATCGENNLNGSAPWYTVPTGTCAKQRYRLACAWLPHRHGPGDERHDRAEHASGAGSPFDDGVDPDGGTFNQSAAFTCNIVAAKVVQCVKGAAYSSGLYSSIGEWLSGSTFVDYLDMDSSTGRTASLMGNVGGQPFGFTAGSGYTNGTYAINAGGCQTTTGANHNNIPIVDVTVSGGAIANVYGSTSADAIGYGMGSSCQFPLTASFTATGTSGAGTISVSAVGSGTLAPGMTISGTGIGSGAKLVLCSSWSDLLWKSGPISADVVGFHEQQRHSQRHDHGNDRRDGRRNRGRDHGSSDLAERRAIRHGDHEQRLDAHGRHSL